jgi:ribosomal protein S5
MNPMMTKEPLIILLGKKGSQGTGIVVSGKVSVVSNFAKMQNLGTVAVGGRTRSSIKFHSIRFAALGMNPRRCPRQQPRATHDQTS